MRNCQRAELDWDNDWTVKRIDDDDDNNDDDDNDDDDDDYKENDIRFQSLLDENYIKNLEHKRTER